MSRFTTYNVSLRNSKQRIISLSLIARLEIRSRCHSQDSLQEYLLSRDEFVVPPREAWRDNRDKSIMVNWIGTSENIATVLAQNGVPGDRNDDIRFYTVVPGFLRRLFDRDAYWKEDLQKIDRFAETQPGYIFKTLSLVGKMLAGVEKGMLCDANNCLNKGDGCNSDELVKFLSELLDKSVQTAPIRFENIVPLVDVLEAFIYACSGIQVSKSSKWTEYFGTKKKGKCPEELASCCRDIKKLLGSFTEALENMKKVTVLDEIPDSSAIFGDIKVSFSRWLKRFRDSVRRRRRLQRFSVLDGIDISMV